MAAHFEYLDELRESGRTNMFGAARYLQIEQRIQLSEAREVLDMWMDTFDPDQTPIDRARAAIAKAEGAA